MAAPGIICIILLPLIVVCLLIGEILKAITSAKDNYYESSKIHYPDILEAVKNRRLKASSNNYVYPNMIALIMALMDNYEGEGVC